MVAVSDPEPCWRGVTRSTLVSETVGSSASYMNVLAGPVFVSPLDESAMATSATYVPVGMSLAQPVNVPGAVHVLSVLLLMAVKFGDVKDQSHADAGVR